MAEYSSGSDSASVETCTVDIELLIEAVRSRPALWNPSAEGYKHMPTKRREWYAIGRIFFADFDEKDESEKLQTSKELQLKWKSTRDAFVRYLRAEESRKAGELTKPVKKYVYRKQMKFLEEISSHTTDVSCINTDSKVKVSPSKERLNKNGQVFKNRRNTVRPRVISVYGRKRRKLNDNVGDFIDVLSKRAQENISRHNSDDLNFFLSLMPSLRTLSNTEKLMFRGDVLKLLLRYTSQDQNVVEVHPMAINEFHCNPIESSGCNFPISSSELNFQNYPPHQSMLGYSEEQQPSCSNQRNAEFQPSSTQAPTETNASGKRQQKRKRKKVDESVTSFSDDMPEGDFIVIKQEYGPQSPIGSLINTTPQNLKDSSSSAVNLAENT